jgi:hypothetical protein
MSTDETPQQRTDLSALTAVEASGRLAVHAWAALEMGDRDEAMRFLSEIMQMSTATIEHAGLDEDSSTLVRNEARDRVGPLVGWVSGVTPAA